MPQEKHQTFTDVLTDKTIPVVKLQEILQQVTAKYEPKLTLSAYNKDRIPIRGIKDGKLSYVEYLNHFRRTLLATCLYYREFKQVPDVNSFLSFADRLGGAGTGDKGAVPVELVNIFFKDENFAKALESLGIVSASIGLSEKQLLALSLLGNFADRRTLNTKLKSIGVTTGEFQTWLSNYRFANAYRQQAEDLLTEVQPVVNMSLVQLATGNTLVNGREAAPDLAALKYLNEVNGRWDPAARQAMDVRVVITRMVEILTSEITETNVSTLNASELLSRIGGRLALMASTLGLNNLEQVQTRSSSINSSNINSSNINSSLDRTSLNSRTGF